MLKHLRTIQDLTAKEIWHIFELTKELKRKPRGKAYDLLRGKTLAMIFQKPSTRTRISFETAMTQLGGHAQYLSASDLQLGRGETIADTAKVLSRYADGIMARVFSHNDIVELAKNSQVSVINGLSDSFHPCQALTDLFTIWETRLRRGFGGREQKALENLTVVFVGDGNNNVANSLLLISAKLGINFKIACPEKYKARREILNLALRDLKQNKLNFETSTDSKKVVKNADIIYTDTWVSMGRQDAKERIKMLKPYQVNQELVALAKKDVMIMHCLPAHRGKEITDQVMDGPNSIIFDQAENRLHVQKAILSLLL